MKNILVVLLLALTTTLLAQIAPQKYSRVKVFLHKTDISELAELGLEYDHGTYAKGRYWINDISTAELAILKANNLDFEVLIEDVQAWYLQQNSLPVDAIAKDRNQKNCPNTNLATAYSTPQNYTYGSMGGYHTYTELLTVLDDMHAKFPALISEKQPIGDYLTQEGRPIYSLKIGNNPNISEEKPEILYTALHHAREPNSLSQMLFFMWYLLENYESDSEVKYLVDNIDLYFIPCVNPDGYHFNSITRPNGGGFWRKNRWVNDKGEITGVDLNRNYGFKWGLNDAGSSSDQMNELYRGTAPFSEPETQAVSAFCNAHQFRIALNYHSFSNLLIFPWGFDNQVTPDNASFRAVGKKLTEQNNYTIGTGLETIGYLTNGDSDDWMYGEQETKGKILSMSPEVGPTASGFWPLRKDIDGLNKDCLWQNLSAAALLKSYGEVSEMNSQSQLLENASGTLTFSLQNIGLATGDLSVSIQSNNPNLIIETNTHTFQLAHLSAQAFAINYRILDSETLMQDLDFEVLIHNGSIERRSIITKIYYNKPFENAFFDDLENGFSNWSKTGNWAISQEQFYSPNGSLTDSPNRNYSDNSTSYIQLKEAIDLTDAQAAILRFRAKWDLEKSFDYVQLKARTPQGTFSPLCGQFTSFNSANQAVYDGTQTEWVLEEIDISKFIGQELFLRFQIQTDNFVNRDGFYLDDFSVEVIREGSVSTATIFPFVPKTLEVRPNPFTTSFEVAFELKEKMPALTIRLLNVLGQEKAVQLLENLGRGSHTFQWENASLENGLYFLQVQGADSQIVTKKVLKIE